MSKRIGEHLRSNVVGYVAIFLFAVGGTAYATHPGGANTISSGDIINQEVKNADLGADSVASGKIQDQQVKNADLSIGASSSNTIADGGIQGVDVKNNTLTGTQIDEPTLFNDNSLTGGDIDESTLNLNRAGEGAGACNADVGTETCASATLNMAHNGALLVTVTGGWFTASFDDPGVSDDTDWVSGTCEIFRDDSATGVTTHVGEERTAAGASPWATGDVVEPRWGTVALTDVSVFIAAGAHTVDVRCSEVDGDITFTNMRITAAALNV